MKGIFNRERITLAEEVDQARPRGSTPQKGPHSAWPSSPLPALLPRCRRHRSLQYLTSSHTCAAQSDRAGAPTARAQRGREKKGEERNHLLPLPPPLERPATDGAHFRRQRALCVLGSLLPLVRSLPGSHGQGAAGRRVAGGRAETGGSCRERSRGRPAQMHSSLSAGLGEGVRFGGKCWNCWWSWRGEGGGAPGVAPRPPGPQGQLDQARNHAAKAAESIGYGCRRAQHSCRAEHAARLQSLQSLAGLAFEQKASVLSVRTPFSHAPSPAAAQGRLEPGLLILVLLVCPAAWRQRNERRDKCCARPPTSRAPSASLAASPRHTPPAAATSGPCRLASPCRGPTWASCGRGSASSTAWWCTTPRRWSRCAGGRGGRTQVTCPCLQRCPAALPVPRRNWGGRRVEAMSRCPHALLNNTRRRWRWRCRARASSLRTLPARQAAGACPRAAAWP